MPKTDETTPQIYEPYSIRSPRKCARDGVVHSRIAHVDARFQDARFTGNATAVQLKTCVRSENPSQLLVLLRNQVGIPEIRKIVNLAISMSNCAQDPDLRAPRSVQDRRYDLLQRPLRGKFRARRLLSSGSAEPCPSGLGDAQPKGGKQFPSEA